MIRHHVETITSKEDVKITVITAHLPLNEETHLEFVFSSYGASLWKVSYQDKDHTKPHLLTLSYNNVFESCHNTSQAGKTIGPNAGRLPANKSLDFGAGLAVVLEPNEDGCKQIHGGDHGLAGVNWAVSDVAFDEVTDTLDIHFVTAQEDGLDGWPGNRHYEVRYTLHGDGSLDMRYNGMTDRDTYLNLTNHTYWMRRAMNMEVQASGYIKNHPGFLPKEVIPVSQDSVAITTDEIWNNAFLIRDNHKPAVNMSYRDIPLRITVSTDAPAVVVYTGDYLDESCLSNSDISYPGCAIALEPQELYPLTPWHITTPEDGFTRKITYQFTV